MWVVLSILAILAALITVVVLLPVKIIIKNDDQNQFILRFQFLFMTFGDNTNKERENTDNPIVKALLSATGFDRLETKTVQKNIRSDGLKKTVSESYTMLTELLREAVALLKRCTVSRLQIKIRCSGDDAAQVAIRYGQYCTATYSLLSVLRNFIKIRKRGCSIDISSNFPAAESVFRYEVVLSFRAARILTGFWRIALGQFKRMAAQKTQQK